MPRTTRGSPAQAALVVLGLTKLLCLDTRSLMCCQVTGLDYWMYTSLTSRLVRE